jgi:hypothetical protein
MLEERDNGRGPHCLEHAFVSACVCIYVFVILS